MPFATKLAIVIISLSILLIIIQLVRKNRLDEKYAMLWIFAGIMMLLAPVGTSIIDTLSSALGFHYPPAFVLLLGFLGLCLINLQFSVVISRISKQNKILAQRYSILERRLADLRKEEMAIGHT